MYPLSAEGRLSRPGRPGLPRPVKEDIGMNRAKPAMAVVLSLLLPLLTGCGRRGEVTRHKAAPPPRARASEPGRGRAEPDPFSQFLSELLLEENEACLPPEAEPVPNLPDLPPLPEEYLPRG
jgi:hypothetical protein